MIWRRVLISALATLFIASGAVAQSISTPGGGVGLSGTLTTGHIVTAAGSTSIQDGGTPITMGTLTDNYASSGTTYCSICLNVTGNSYAVATKVFSLVQNNAEVIGVDAPGNWYSNNSSGTFVLKENTGGTYQTVLSIGANSNSLIGGVNSNGSGGIQYQSARASQTTNLAISTTQTSGLHYDNIGATGEVDFTLPSSATTRKGMNYCFTVAAAQIVKVIAGTGVSIAVGASNSASAGNITDSTVYGTVCLEAITTTQWVAMSVTGTWTVN